MKARVVLMAAAVLAASVAFASEGYRHHRGPDMERMAVLLDLTDSQRTEVERILNARHEKVRAAHEERRAAGTKPTREERVKLHEEMKQETLTELQSVLTPEQIKKFEAYTQHRSHRRARAEQ